MMSFLLEDGSQTSTNHASHQAGIQHSQQTRVRFGRVACAVGAPVSVWWNLEATTIREFVSKASPTTYTKS